MPHAYVTLETLKSTGALNLGTGTPYDTRLRQLTEGIAEQVDRYANRAKTTFQPRTDTLYFSGDNSTLLLVPDLISITSLKEDNNQDGTFDTTWNANDYFLMPYNADPTSDWGMPYNALQVSPKSNGTQDAFLAGPRRYEIVGTWGYREVTGTTGAKTSGTIGTSGTTTFTADTAGIEPGMTILVQSEQMYVKSTSGTAVTVERGVNGSTATTHATTLDVNYYIYPQPVQEATIIQASRIWKRKDSGFASEVGFPDIGMTTTWRGGLDPDVKQLLFPFRRLH